jgi:sulfide:quinone oxidoreductase
VTTLAGERMPYDMLLVAAGARAVGAVPGAVMFSGSATDRGRLREIVEDVDAGRLRRLAFVVPVVRTWPLPLYELALMLAERARSPLELHLVTPEATPLELFGPEASREVARLLDAAGIALHTGAGAGTAATLAVERIVALPRLEGPAIPGLPADAHGFIVVDRHCRVRGVADVYAAGDATAFAIKQGGIACQQADAAAAHIAATAGAPVVPEPFRPVLRGVLLTEREARFLRRDADGSRVAGRALWWPPAKIAGRELAGYLEGLDEATGRAAGLRVNVAIGDTGTDEIEVLSLHPPITRG